MTLFDEMQQLSSESHAKWFERYFEKYNLEQKLKTSAQKGYTGYLINVWSVRDEYLRNRLGDERTLEALRELLEADFTVKYKLYLSKNIFTGQDFVSNKKIHITW
ncbi:TPA: hypothetical protein ACPX53_001226 [Streptococcus pneumoniae]